QLLGERFQIFQRQTLRPEALLVFLLRVVERPLAVHELEQELFLFLETVIAQAHRVLDDVVCPPLKLLRVNRQIAAQPNANLLAALQISSSSRFVHREKTLLLPAQMTNLE